MASVLVLLLGTVGSACAQDTQVTASVGSDSVGVLDQLQLKITVSGKDSGDAEPPRLPLLKGFKVVAGPNVGTQFQWVNGRTSSSKSFTYILIPEREGQFTIGEMEVRAGGKIYKTQPLQIRVTSAAPRTSPPPQPSVNPFDPFGDEEIAGKNRLSADALFVKAELSRDSAYAGQQITLSYKIYTQVSISGFQLQESPPLSGFWVEDLEVGTNPKGVRQVVDGREYSVFTVKKQALFGTAVGKLKIPSSIFAFSVEAAGSVFGIFNRMETVYRSTPEIYLEVKPLPAAGRPPGYANAVGSFTLSSSIDKARVATGEAVALKINLQGQGNLKMIPDLTLPEIPDLTFYSSKRADSIQPSPEGRIGGDRRWEYVLVPKAPGKQAIPPISFSFFDPEKERFETVATPALDLDVVRGGSDGISVLSGSGKQDLVRRGSDINFIKMSAGDFKRPDTPFSETRWLWVLAAIPLMVNTGILVHRKRQSRIEAKAGAGRGARRQALRLLKSAEKGGHADARHFYDQASAALSGYLSERFRLTGIELTGDNLERTLSQKEIPIEILEETRDCLQECDFGRFVSASASGQKMRDLADRIRSNIESLEKASSQSRVRS